MSLTALECLELEVISENYVSCSVNTECGLILEGSYGSTKAYGIYLYGSMAQLTYPLNIYLWAHIHDDNLQESVVSILWVLRIELK